MARYARPYRRRKKLYSYKKRKSTYKKRRFYRKRARGMQKIKKVRWPARNIGGDRAYCKLRYVVGSDFPIQAETFFTARTLRMNTGAIETALGPGERTVNYLFGDTPNLSTLGALYLNYRIRGVKLKLTYWQQDGSPVVLFTNAQSDQNEFYADEPAPPFVSPNISVLPEQRWARSRVCGATAAGARPTTLTSYYSVNKVYGPDAVVKNDRDFIGEMTVATPYWSTNATTGGVPVRSPWLQYGIFTLNGAPIPEGDSVNGVLKVEATVYCEFFGKRVQTQ